MRILIDADGCPVVDICIRTARAHGVKCFILCDSAHIFERGGAQTITVSKGADSVDFKIISLIERGDIVVTQDYGLAAMCLARGARAVNQDGMVYSGENIDSLLNLRYESRRVRLAHGRIKGPHKRRPEQNILLEQALEKLCGQP